MLFLWKENEIDSSDSSLKGNEEKKADYSRKTFDMEVILQPSKLYKILSLNLSNGKGHISRTGQKGQLCNKTFREIHSLHSIFLIFSR